MSGPDTLGGTFAEGRGAGCSRGEALADEVAEALQRFPPVPPKLKAIFDIERFQALKWGVNPDRTAFEAIKSECKVLLIGLMDKGSQF